MLTLHLQEQISITSVWSYLLRHCKRGCATPQPQSSISKGTGSMNGSKGPYLEQRLGKRIKGGQSNVSLHSSNSELHWRNVENSGYILTHSTLCLCRSWMKNVRLFWGRNSGLNSTCTDLIWLQWMLLYVISNVNGYVHTGFPLGRFYLCNW